MTALFAEPTPEDLVVLDVRRADTSATIVATGEIDSSSAPEFRQTLEALLHEPGMTEVVVDLGGITFLDSAGLCVLAAAHRQTKSTGVQLRVLASSRAVIRPLQITGLWDLLRVEQGAGPTGVASSIATIPVQS